MPIGTGIGANYSSRAIIGSFYERLGNTQPPAWVTDLSRRIDSNQSSEDLIMRNAHLIREEEFPASLLLFIMHATSYRAMVAKWKQGDYSEYLPNSDYPVELSTYAAQSYRELKHEQLQLIGRLKPKQAPQ